MKYKAYLKQEGEGCDYTIGCAQTVIDIDANNINDAEIKLIKILLEWYSAETILEYVELYEISETRIIQISDIYSGKNNLDKIKNSQTQDDFELKEFERLKNKFGFNDYKSNLIKYKEKGYHPRFSGATAISHDEPLICDCCNRKTMTKAIYEANYPNNPDIGMCPACCDEYYYILK